MVLYVVPLSHQSDPDLGTPSGERLLSTKSGCPLNRGHISKRHHIRQCELQYGAVCGPPQSPRCSIRNNRNGTYCTAALYIYQCSYGKSDPDLGTPSGERLLSTKSGCPLNRGHISSHPTSIPVNQGPKRQFAICGHRTIDAVPTYYRRIINAL
eukprot:sb/3473274/